MRIPLIPHIGSMIFEEHSQSWLHLDAKFKCFNPTERLEENFSNQLIILHSIKLNYSFESYDELVPAILTFWHPRKINENIPRVHKMLQIIAILDAPLESILKCLTR